jgi:hypothetical protein
MYYGQAARHRRGIACCVCEGWAAEAVLPRERGASNTPRPRDLINDVSGILDRPLSRMMTSESLQTQFRDLAAPFARVLLFTSALSNQRAQGTPDARCTRGLACNLHKRNAHEHTGSAEAIRHSLRNGFTAYSVLSPVNGLSCHRCAANKSATRDASVAASEPHAFAVRFSAVRQGHISVHRISTHVRDDRERPSCRVRRAERNH